MIISATFLIANIIVDLLVAVMFSLIIYIEDKMYRTPRSLKKLLTELQAVVDTKVSEVEGVRRAQPFVDWYQAADHDARADAWRLMTEQFSPDPKKVKLAKDQYEAALGTEDEAQAEIKLRKAFHSPRTRLYAI